MIELLKVTCLSLALTACCVAQDAAVPDGAAWVVRETRARLGASRIVVLKLAEKATKDMTFHVEVKPKKALSILAPLRALAGYDLAYMRVRPEVRGDVDLLVAGLGKPGHLRLHVVTAAAAYPTVSHTVPQFVSPKAHAHLWGDVLVGARITGRRPSRARLLLGRQVVAETADHETIDGVWRLRFPLSVAGLPAGPARLTIQTSYPDGSQRQSRPLEVTLVHPAKGRARVYESEDLARASLPKVVRDRRRPRVSNDRKASGGRFTLHIGPDPFTQVRVGVGVGAGNGTGKTNGKQKKQKQTRKGKDQWYQLAIIAKGSYAGGAWPTVGVVVDNDRNRPRTNTPLLDEDWHRVIVGRPFRVPAGEHMVGARFLNDTYVPGVLDRNLYLDRIELLSLDLVLEESVSIQLDHRAFGRTVPGAFAVQGIVSRPGVQRRRPPLTRLVVNGKILASQRSDRPRFTVGTHALVAGENHLRLVTVLASGREVTTDPVSFRWHGQGQRIDDLLRFTAADDRFKAANPKVLGFERNAPDGHVFRFSSNGTAVLDLPEDLAGTFDLSLYMHGRSFRGNAKARVTLDDKEVKVLDANTSWRSHAAGRIELSKGAKRLAVSFVNDLHEKGKGDRNLSFGAFELRSVDPRPDQTGPTITVHYPKPGKKIGTVDAVVADVTDASGVRDVAMLIDGKLVPGVFERLGGRADSRVCLPFTDRRLQPGLHELQVVATDRYGRKTTSPAIAVELVAAPGVSPYERAVHFLNRFGYGPEPRLLAEVLLGSPAEMLRRALAKGFDRQALRAAEQRFPTGTSTYHISRRVVDMARRNDNPIRTRLLLFWENHFTTWIRKVGAQSAWEEHLRFQEVANADFGQLLRASAHSPAMMRYLDNTRSFAGRINENYAREIMELHTLGVAGGYTQKDVEALSRVLTGWSATSASGRLEFAFLAGLHDRSAQTVIGYRVPAVARDASGAKAWNLARDRGETMLEVLMAHPSTARFLASKLVAHYVAHPAPPAVVNAVAKTYLETGGDVGAMLQTILGSEAFAGVSPGGKGTDPFEFALRLCRLGRWDNPWDMATLLDAVQRLPMERSTPDGYPEEAAAWFDSSSTLQRWRFVERAAGSIRWQLFHGPARSNRAIRDPNWNQGLIDSLAVRFFGRRLSNKSNATALKVLADAKRDVNTRIGLAISILGQLPEAHMH
jgi:uncharacterized protein (DUF1800 family)